MVLNLKIHQPIDTYIQKYINKKRVQADKNNNS